MTDYTPALETPAEKSLKYCETEYRLLIREAARLKDERDKLLELVKFFVALQTSPLSLEDACPEEFAKARELIERIDRDK